MGIYDVTGGMIAEITAMKISVVSELKNWVTKYNGSFLLIWNIIEYFTISTNPSWTANSNYLERQELLE